MSFLSHKLLRKCLIVLLLLISLGCWTANNYQIISGDAVLSLSGPFSKKLNLTLSINDIDYKTINHPYPITLEVNEETLSGFYAEIIKEENSLICTGNLISKQGSVFEITDVFSADFNGYFQLKRKVKVLKKSQSDEFFNSYFGWMIKTPSTVDDFEFFVPGIWYKDNQYLTKRALANDYSDNYFYFREDRLPLPTISCRDKANGNTFQMMHVDAKPETFFGENGLSRIVDERMQFGSLGFAQVDGLSVQFVYPGIEGEKTYTGRLDNKQQYFSYRSHPVEVGINHSYQLVFGEVNANSFADLVENSWKYVWEKYNPPIHKMDIKDAYQASIEVLDVYLQNVNEAPGWPFSIYLPNGVARAYNYQMGFIGAQISNAAFLLRYGLENNNQRLVKRASEVIDFWIHDSMTDVGLPKTWTDAYVDKKNTWRTYETYMRSTAGGMEGMITAWNTMKKHGYDKPEWLNYCKKYATWLINNQNEDGSFFNRYQWENSKPNHDSKYTTTNIIRFLVELYCVTGNNLYLKTALKAGEFSYDFIHNNYLYVGSVIDNPNVKDRESGQLAIYAFLSLYDVTKDDKWKEAAIQAARYTETFMFAYDVPMAVNDSLTDFPRHRDITGFTLIATGHSGIDNGLSFSSFQYYRLYLITGDKHFLHVAKVIQNNTLQIMDLDGKMRYRYRGLLTECFGPQSNRGHSVRQQLPWNQAAVLEPMHRFMDAFNEWDIDVIEQWPLEKRLNLMETYSNNQGLASENK